MPSNNKLIKLKEKEQKKEEEENKKLLDDYWSQGTDKKGEKKAKLQHEKQIEKMQKAKEKQDLLQEDEDSMKDMKLNIKKSKYKNNGPIFTPKINEQTIEEEKLKQIQLRIQREEKEMLREKQEKEAQLKNINLYHQDELMIKPDNTLDDSDDNIISGIDDAIDFLNNKNTIMTFNEYYELELENLKRGFPGLRLSQYNDRIHKSWKNSKYNPKNMI
jgi:hypothetical protein